MVFSEKLKSNKTKKVFFLFTLITSILAGMHFGCQELIFDTKENNISRHMKYLCPNKKYISSLRYVGTGTNLFIVCLFIYNLEYIDHILQVT